MANILIPEELVVNTLNRFALENKLSYEINEHTYFEYLHILSEPERAEEFLRTIMPESYLTEEIVYHVLAYEYHPAALETAIYLTIKGCLLLESYEQVKRVASTFDIDAVHEIFYKFAEEPVDLMNLLHLAGNLAYHTMSKAATKKGLEFAASYAGTDSLVYIGGGLTGLVEVTGNADLKFALEIARKYDGETLEAFMDALNVCTETPEIFGMPVYNAVSFVLSTADILKENPDIALAVLSAYADETQKQREWLEEFYS